MHAERPHSGQHGHSRAPRIRKSVTISIGISLCPYRIVYRRAQESSTSSLFKASLRRPAGGGGALFLSLHKGLVFLPVAGPSRYGPHTHRRRGGIVFEAHRLLYHSTLGSRVIKKKKKRSTVDAARPGLSSVPTHIRKSSGRGRGREGERGERETRGYERFALHAPMHWAISGYVIKDTGVIKSLCHAPSTRRGQGCPRSPRTFGSLSAASPGILPPDTPSQSSSEPRS